MAVNIDKIVISAFIDLLDKKSLSKITIQTILNSCGVSRQTFYNHFKDKEDLIQKTYEQCVVAEFNTNASVNLNYYDAVTRLLNLDMKYRNFLCQAFEYEGPNNLENYVYKHSIKFDRSYHQYFYGNQPLTPLLQYASDYHSAAVAKMRIDWIKDGCKIPPETLVKYWLIIRTNSLSSLVNRDGLSTDPYTACLDQFSDETKK